VTHGGTNAVTPGDVVRQPDRMTNGPDPSRLVLRPPAISDEEQARRAHEELTADDFTFLLFFDGGDWSDYVATVNLRTRGADRVPGAFLLADVGGVVVGRASIRYELNDWLRRFGGHVGYCVRPQFRRRGYATAILRRSLEVLGGTGVERALVTCDDDNLASAAVIERCGGVLEDVTDADGDEAAKRRYWISVPRIG
jgi:predicted acetyltransferase